MAFLPVAAAGASLIGGIMQYEGGQTSAKAQLEQGYANALANNYAAAVAQNNATIANQNATYAESAGLQQSTVTGLESAAKAGEVKAAQAASGVDVNTGSAPIVQASQREQGELDAETVLNNAQLQAYGYRTQAANFTAQSVLEKAAGTQAITGAEIGAQGTEEGATAGLLGNASSVALKWSQLGGFGGGGSTDSFAGASASGASGGSPFFPA